MTSSISKDANTIGHLTKQKLGHRFNLDALNYFLDELMCRKLEYIPSTGEFWRYWEPRREWLPAPKRAEFPNGFGYLYIRTRQVSIGKQLNVAAHRVAWSYVYGAIPDWCEINHIDGVKSNNRISNLEAVSASDNQIHALRTGLFVPNTTKLPHYRAVSDEQIEAITVLLQSGSHTQVEIASMYGIRPGVVSRINIGKLKVRK